MGLLDRVFGTSTTTSRPMPEPRLTGSSRPAAPPAIQALIDELNLIGDDEGFLSAGRSVPFDAQGHHIRARAIGEQLHKMGGTMLMRRVYRRVESARSRQLEVVWTGIGDGLN